MHRSGTLAAAALLGIAGTWTASAPAVAGTADRGTYTQSYTDTIDACGTPVGVSGTVVGRYLDQLRGSDPEPYYHDHFTDTTTFTNLDTRRSYVTVNEATHIDIQRVEVTGTIIRATGQDAGTFSVYDGNGNLYRRQAGLQRGTFVIDTMGTADPSDDVLLDVEFSSYGHLPSADFCADVQALTG